MRFLLHLRIGRASVTWPSSLMPWTRRSMTDGRVHRGGLIPYSDRDFNTCRSSIPSSWRRQAPSRPSAALAIPMTTLSLSRSTVFKTSPGEGHGATSKPWSSPHSNGFTGSITAAFWHPSGIFRQQRQKNDTTPCWTHQLWPHNFKQTVSGKLGVVHCGEGANMQVSTYPHC
jgi:hypothetical protein